VISWGTILYGAALSAILAVAAVFLIAGERKPLVLALVALSAILGPLGWNAVLHSAGNDDFFHDAPVSVFPVSWQDCGSGVWTLALASVVQGVIQTRARRALLLALLTALVAWLVDIYLY
jgi:hypothetical protein